MAFLDNSGDIILDAVLTDTGRMRLATGNFDIAYYGFGDDEINYALYRNANHSSGAHPSGSAYYDLDILQTPILEAFTDNAANLKSRLVTYTGVTHLNLPILKLNESDPMNKRNAAANTGEAPNKFVVTADAETSRSFQNSTRPGLHRPSNGMIKGVGADMTEVIKIDQGLDTDVPTPTTPLEDELTETSYTIQIDNRLGRITTATKTPAPKIFTDDDNIANYRVASLTDNTFVYNNTFKQLVPEQGQVVKGPRGTTLAFSIEASQEIQNSNDLFQKMGNMDATWTELPSAGGDDGTTAASNAASIYYIDTIVRVRGVTTGYKIDIPVRFVKLASARAL